MAVDRSCPSWFIHLTIAASTGAGTVTPWVQIPPTIANKLHGTATFAGTTGIMKLFGKLSSASTAATALLSRTQAQRSAVIASTVPTMVNWVRAGSTKLTGGAGTIYVAGIVS